MNKTFLTQEIGSIQRPIWRQKLEAPANKEWIKSALDWGEKFGVEERHELANPSGKGLLQKDGKKRTAAEKQRIVEISSIYVIKMFEHALKVPLFPSGNVISQCGHFPSADVFLVKDIDKNCVQILFNGFKLLVDFIRCHAQLTRIGNNEFARTGCGVTD